MKNTNLIPEHKILTDYLDYKDAQLIEKNLIDDYRKNNWTVLNIKGGGQLGGWEGYLTNERLHQEALKYKSFTEFRKNSFFAFRKIQKNKLFYMLEHLERKRKKVTCEHCKRELDLNSYKRYHGNKCKSLLSS